MRFLIFPWMSLCALCFSLSVSAVEGKVEVELEADPVEITAAAQEIDWSMLKGTIEAYDDPFIALTDNQKYNLAMVARIRSLRAELADGTTLEEGMLKSLAASKKVLDDEKIDIDGLLAKRNEIADLRRKASMATNDSLNEKKIRMAGFILPLDIEKGKTAEFLLVPWVGACIHTPSPSANQIVYVKMNEAILVRTRFQAVWIEGILSVESVEKELYLVDGTSNIPSSYVLQGLTVEDYNPEPK